MPKKIDGSGLTQADRIRGYSHVHPEATPAEIAEAVGCRHQVVLRVLRPTRKEPNEDDIKCLAYLAYSPGDAGIGEKKTGTVYTPGTRLRAVWAPLHAKPGTVRLFTFIILMDMELLIQYEEEKYCVTEIALEYLEDRAERIITYRFTTLMGSDLVSAVPHDEERWTYEEPLKFIDQCNKFNRKYHEKQLPYYHISDINVKLYPESFKKVKQMVFDLESELHFQKYGTHYE
jgi:hypothetical protein